MALGQAAIERGEAVLALLRRLRTRPVIACPEQAESSEEFFSRVDSARHAAALSEEQYAGLLSGRDVRWKSVLAFLTQDEDGAVTRAFWIDPLRLRCFGCRLDEDDLEVLAPFFGLDAPSLSANDGNHTTVDHTASRLLSAIELVRGECTGRSDDDSSRDLTSRATDLGLTITSRKRDGARRTNLKLMRRDKDRPRE